MKLHQACSKMGPALLAMTFVTSAVFAQGTAPRAGSSAGVALTDGQILQIAKTLNDGEIKQAGEAQDESDNAEVKRLAQMIMADHENSNEEIDKLLDGSLDLDDSALADTLESDAEQSHERLQDLSGTQYDCSYLQVQVAQHEKAINISKTQLMPNAKNADVKQFLTVTGPKLEQHLEMAKMAHDKASCS